MSLLLGHLHAGRRSWSRLSSKPLRCGTRFVSSYVETSFADPEMLMEHAMKQADETPAGSRPPPVLAMRPTRKSNYKRGRPMRLFKKGSPLLQDALHNKGVAFSMPERERLGLRGLLPPAVYSLEHQYERMMVAYQEEAEQMRAGNRTMLDLWNFLQGVKHRNRVLYYKALMENFQSMGPIVYTPTIGQICTSWQHLWVPGRHKEMYFSMKDLGEMAPMIYNYLAEEVDLVICTDGSRVLGLGDLGLNGAGICIGKMDLYVAGAGFDPSRILPVSLDFGTDNDKLREDPFYLGVREARPKGEEYYAMVDEFIRAVRRRYPYALIHFEDFETEKARELLHRYRYNSFVFNDDIQGTASVTLAAFLAYARASGTPLSQLKIVCAGAGSSAIGILDLTAKFIAQETGQLEDEVRANFFVLDSRGLIGMGRSKGLNKDKSRYISSLPDGLSLLDTVREARPNVLFGCSTIGGMFTDEVLEEVAKHQGAPLVMPLSNPTSKAECTLEATVRCTQGKAYFASGSPFDDVTQAGKLHYGNQCNNAFVFPGLAMGAILSGATRVNDEMLMAASRRLAETMTLEEVQKGKLFPRVENIRSVTELITAAVARCAVETNVALGGSHGIDWHADDEVVVEKIRPYMWEPEYVTYIDSTWSRETSDS